jgi:Protein of unknown function (DUF3887)
MKSTRALFLIAILFATLLSACAAKAESLSVTDRMAFLTYAEPAAENMLQGYNAHDYATFSKDFDQAMKSSITPSAFEDLYTKLNGKIGKYISRQVATVDKVQGYLRMTLKAQFENENDVSVLVVFDSNESHTIAGLFFSSPKLSQ